MPKIPTTADLLKEVIDSSKTIEDPISRFHALRAAMNGFAGDELRAVVEESAAALREIKPKNAQEIQQKNTLMAGFAQVVRQYEAK